MPFRYLARRFPVAAKPLSFIAGVIQMILVAINIKNVASGNVVFAMGFTAFNTFYLQSVTRMWNEFSLAERICNALGSAAGVAIGIAVHHYLLAPRAITHLSTILGL